MSEKEKLFNPNYIFTGSPKKYLIDYPSRSKNLEVNSSSLSSKDVNQKFIKDGYAYLLRGAKNGQESGFYSREYANKKTIESLHLDSESVAEAQTLNGNTPFISTTTDLIVAAAFSLKQRIYIIKVPIEDIYTLTKGKLLSETLNENEVMIPDFISSDEIIKSFRFDKFKQIYTFLTREVGLDLLPEDLGVTYEELKNPDIAKIDRYIEFNESGSYWDDVLNIIRDCMIYSNIPEEEGPILSKKKNSSL